MKVASSSKALLLIFCFLLFASSNASAQQAPASNEHTIYKQLKAFALTGGAIDVKGLALKRDRVQITLDGVVYFNEPVNGRMTGAVFIGEGNVIVETPPSDF